MVEKRAHVDRDPLYQKIVEGLAGTLEGNRFEQCAQALLMDAYPNLTPVSGGSDNGLDGAFGTPEGAFPLICTVSEDVIGNVRRNIQTYLANRNGPRIAVVATSRVLSERRRKNIEDAAEELGIQIANIHDGVYFANRLYRDRGWRTELLGITGRPSALSPFPNRNRASVVSHVVGRDDDIAWITAADHDLLIVGQPGSGKTYLHQHLAASGNCLFVVDDDPEALADDIRDLQPSILVVDDAHTQHGLLVLLIRLCKQINANYRIHANCWPSHKASVQQTLCLRPNQVRELRRLPRRTILEIVRSLGIGGPDQLLQMLVDQSDGKPGLTAALVDVCRHERGKGIWSGETIARTLLEHPAHRLSQTERCVLAAFAIGGDSGMSYRDVCAGLNLATVQLREIVTNLGAGGLVEELSADRLQVRPPAIRPILVRDVFYGGPCPIEPDPLLRAAKSPSDTAHVLLSARQRGATIERSLLEQFVRTADSRQAWEHFAFVGPEFAALILDRYPERVCDAAPGLLHFHPEKSLKSLLQADIDGRVRAEGAIHHARRRITDWLVPADLDEAARVTMERRLTLLQVLEDQASNESLTSNEVFAWALGRVVDPRLNITKVSPGDDRHFVFSRGVVSAETLTRIASIWARVIQLAAIMPTSLYRTFLDACEDWLVPQRLSGTRPLSDESLETLRAQGARMLADILGLPHCNRACRTWAAEVARIGRLGLGVEVDEIFDALFAQRQAAGDWRAADEGRLARLRTFAEELMSSSPREGVRCLVGLWSEAESFGHKTSGYLWVPYAHVATNCLLPQDWIAAIIEQNVSAIFLEMFLGRLQRDDYTGYVDCLTDLIERPTYAELASRHVVQMSSPPASLLERSLAAISKVDAESTFGMCGDAISASTMGRLLSHPDRTVRRTAALAEWRRDSNAIRSELKELWQEAVLEVDSDQYELEAILAANSSIARPWLEMQIRKASRFRPDHGIAVGLAANLLTVAERCELVELLTVDNFTNELFDSLVGERTEVLSYWFRRQHNEDLRLLPLDREIGPQWEQLALIALDAGATSEEIADHCVPMSYSCGWQASEYFANQIPKYEALASHADSRLRPAGKRGLSWATRNMQAELKQEALEELY